MRIGSFEKNTIKKALWVYLLCSIILPVFSSNKMLSLGAFLFGSFAGCIKLFFFGKLSDLIFLSKKTCVTPLMGLVYMLAIMSIYVAMVFSAYFGIQPFIYFTLGVIIINLVVYFSSILEILGVSKNNF